VKLAEFDLDFDCFAYKINEFGSKQRDSKDAIRHKESRATKTMVSAIVSAGENDQQGALALHGALIDPRTQTTAKFAGFQLDRMEATSFHWDQLKKMLEARSLKTGKVNIDQSMAVDALLAAVMLATWCVTQMGQQMLMKRRRPCQPL
jgi:hypothetical protein